MPSGVVPHERPCLLQLCLTICHAFWCGASLSATPAGVLPHTSGVVPHYRPCLLVLGHCRPTIFLLVECIWKKDVYKSGATHTGMQLHQTWLLILCHSNMPACTVQLYQTYIQGSFIQICVFVKCFSIRQDIWLLQSHQTCLQEGRHSHRFAKFVSYRPGRHLECIECLVMHELHHWYVTRLMSVIQESVN